MRRWPNIKRVVAGGWENKYAISKLLSGAKEKNKNNKNNFPNVRQDLCHDCNFLLSFQKGDLDLSNGSICLLLNTGLTGIRNAYLQYRKGLNDLTLDV